MNISERLEKIRAYALTAKTAIYNEDAMTSIELAGQTACKVNECVDAINELIEIVDEIQTDHLGLHYDADNETVIV